MPRGYTSPFLILPDFHLAIIETYLSKRIIIDCLINLIYLDYHFHCYITVKMLEYARRWRSGFIY